MIIPYYSHINSQLSFSMKQTINFGDKPSDHARQIQAYQVLGISYFGNEHTASPMNEAWMIWMGARMGARLNGWMDGSRLIFFFLTRSRWGDV